MYETRTLMKSFGHCVDVLIFLVHYFQLNKSKSHDKFSRITELALIRRSFCHPENTL